MGDGTEVRTEKGKQILAHAMASEHCVLEFTEQDDGTMQVMDITDHVEQLERIVNNENK